MVGINKIRVERAREVNGRPPGQTTEGKCVDGKESGLMMGWSLKPSEVTLYVPTIIEGRHTTRVTKHRCNHR
jgi:hypothetical protein